MGKYCDLPPGKQRVSIPTCFEASLTGCVRAQQGRDGAIELVHTDGTTERAEWTNAPELDALSDNWCSLVEIVEAKVNLEKAEGVLRRIDNAMMLLVKRDKQLAKILVSLRPFAEKGGE